MSNPIVTVTVTQQIAPLPSELQKTGAMISQGGTVQVIGSKTLIQQPSDYTAIATPPVIINALTWSGGIAVVTSSADLGGLPSGTTFQTTIAGASPDGYNGSFNAIVTGATSFEYFIDNPGAAAATVHGTFTDPATGELQAMVNTFFAQGMSQGCYILELGGPSSTPATAPSAAIANLRSFISNNDQFFYSYLVPRNWDGLQALRDLLADFESTTSKTYFFITTTTSTYQSYLNNPDGTSTYKDAVTLCAAPKYGAWPANAIVSGTFTTPAATIVTTTAHGVLPGDSFTIDGAVPAAYGGTFVALPGTTGTSLKYRPLTDPGGPMTAGTLRASLYGSPGTAGAEFTMAAAWWVTLNYSPSSTSRVPPYSYSFLKGVTQFPSGGNQVLMTQLKAASVNIVGFGAEGGISDRILMYGRTMDGRPFNYWYSVDWMQIAIDRNIANAIINGSNTTVNPLYYTQDGINRLAGVSGQTGANGISYGLALGRIVLLGLPQQQFMDNLNKGLYAGTLVVNADPFTNYLAANPSHYRQGLYGGLTMVYTPLRGFEHIIFSIVVTDFVATA